MIGPSDATDDTGFAGVMTMNYRLYGTIILLIVMCVVACGVRFVQLFAPLSLCCVILTIFAMYIGSMHKMIAPTAGPEYVMLFVIVQIAIFSPEYASTTMPSCGDKRSCRDTPTPLLCANSATPPTAALSYAMSWREIAPKTTQTARQRAN